MTGVHPGTAERGRSRPSHTALWAVLVGGLAALVSMLGSWTPSYWSDEVATLRASRLGWTELFDFLGEKDAVHAGYYSIMKLWTGVFGESELATRSVSALAVGLAAAGLVVLVTSVGGLHLGIVAGILFAVLPRTTYLGIESRSFAVSALIAVWATIALLGAIRRPSWPGWLLYSAAIAAGTYLFLYSVLLLAVHALVLLVGSRSRRILPRWALAAGVAVLAGLPVILLGARQKEQIAWLADQPVVNVWTIMVEPAFDSSWPVAAIAWLLVVILSVRLLLPARGRALATGPERSLLGLAAAWVALPMLLLLVADTVIGPLYTARYLSFTVPGFAIVLAIAVTRTPRKSVTWLLIGAVVIAGLPTYLAQRGPFAKNGGSDLAQIADRVEELASPGDAVYLQDTGSVTLRPRQALYAYPDAFANLVDVAFVEAFTATGTFSDTTTAWADLGPLLIEVDRIWVVTAGTSALDAPALLLPRGYVEGARYSTNRSTITLFERGPER